MIETLNMQGYLTLIGTDRAGRVIQRQRVKNRIVSSGRNLVAEMFSGQFAGPPPTPVTHMAVGTGTNAPADSDTALQAQRGARKAITSTQVTQFNEAGVNRVRVSLQTVFDFNEANDPAIPLTEAGIFTAATGGVMYNRVVFEPVTKTNAFKLTLLWDVIF
jgi:hypothetical protein